MNRYQNVIFILTFLAIAAVIELIRQKYGIPITILDLILTPATLVIAFFILRYLIQKNYEPDNGNLDNLSLVKRLAVLAGFIILMIPLGAWCAFMGAREPLGYFTGVKGAAHGYTVFIVGMAVLAVGFFGVYKVINHILSNKKE
ncbi:MAG: hypothetical protein GY729_21980 [Desulfobacteraceae bacterium]|nr:hypothetical protein [Desulfobacteraceae bacterium]